MMSMSRRRFAQLYKQHTLYLETKGKQGELINLDGVNLTKCIDKDTHYDLSRASFENCDFAFCDLRACKFSGTTFYMCRLECAIADYVDFSHAGLSCCNMRCLSATQANFAQSRILDCQLRNAELLCTKFTHAEIGGSNFSGAVLDENTKFTGVPCHPGNTGLYPVVPMEGSYIAWKKAYTHDDKPVIVKLEIPADAKRSSGTTRKCRASKAKVLGFYSKKRKELKCAEAVSWYSRTFRYAVGKTVKADSFDDNRWAECTNGIHHFMTFEEARDYRG